MFPTDPFGGSGDAAWIRYHNARGGEKGTLEIGISNEADDHIALMPSGYVGIGTTDPKAKLEVVGTVVAANSDRTRFVQLWSDNAIIANSSAELRIGFATDLVASSWSEKMRITAAGNVGIGTTSPGAPLHVASYMAVGPFSATVGAGGIDVTGPTAEFGFVRRSLTAWPATPAAGDRFVWYNPDGSARLWTEVKGDLLVVSKEGNVGIGTTNPQARLHVSPLGQSTGARGIQLDEVDAIGNLTNRHLNIYYEGQGTVVFYHQNTLGQFMPQDGLWYHNSDAVLKENIARLSNTLAKTLQLRPVHFTWRNTAMESIGFVAQEVEQVFPDLVSSVNVNGQEIKALPYTSFAVIAIAALQELAQTYDAKITALENQIKAFL
jgi:hypothetical protein